ncbi:MAG TPA: multicopper oxidase family protein [Chloroflexia bacterium]|nr:multicopper oxidase family protein [Chloroflexia bacterium]
MMHTTLQLKRRSALLALAVALLAACLLGSRPASAAGNTLPSTTCTLDNGIRKCDLWAKTGSIQLPNLASGTYTPDGKTVTIWGYSATAAGAAQLPGPTLIVNQGETVQITLHNGLAENTSLNLPGQPVAPDTTGATPGNTKTYTFTPGEAGTQLYEAGLTANGPKQVAMGLFGALIVRPSGNAGAIYDGATAFTDEGLFIFSEIDPALNANPSGFALRNFAPKYWLINGKPYTKDSDFPVQAGGNVALRYLNAGLMDHSVSTLGLSQTIVGIDGHKLDNPYGVVAETLTSGQTFDVLVAIPASAAQNTRYAIYDGARHLDNSGFSDSSHQLYPGGMLSFLKVGTANSSGDSVGPSTTGLALTPVVSTGKNDLTLVGSISDASSGNANVISASYFFDSTSGSGTPVTISTPAPTVNLSVTIPSASLIGLTTGQHTLYVRGVDANNNAGAFSSIVFTIDKDGPVTSGSVSPAASNGSQDVVFSGTANDGANGNSKVVAAEYNLDGGAMTSLTIDAASQASTVPLTFTVSKTTVAALSQGSHTLNIHSKDYLGNWGSNLAVQFTVDKTGPAVTIQNIAPNPNNGSQVLDVNNLGVRLDATATDTLSNVVAGEIFLDSVKADGSGLPMQPVDGTFSSLSEKIYDLILLTDGIQNLTPGSHPVYVHAKDAAGNWGPATSVNLVIDKAAPTLSGLSVSPVSTTGSTSVTLGGTASDTASNGSPASNITTVEWFDGTDPGVGKATAITITPSTSVSFTTSINPSGWSVGSHVLSVRARDAAGNWSAVQTVTLTITLPANIIFADGFESGNLSPWSSTAGATRLSVTAAAAQGGSTRGLQIAAGTGSAYVQDNSPANESVYNARFYFNPNGAAFNGTTISLFQALNASNTVVARVELRLNNGIYQVRAGVLKNNGTTSYTAWTNVSNASHLLEIDWSAGTNATLNFSVDGSAVQPVTGVANTNYRVDTVRLGVVTGTLRNAPLYFDGFSSSKTAFTGP